jgi:aspartate-semialdehyde dehydrogenase
MKKRVALVGATGIAGQQFITALEDHPWFEIKRIAGSKRSAGKSYQEALKQDNGQISWWQPTQIPEHIASMTVELGEDLILDDIDVVFTAIESDAAKILEPLYAKHKPTISTASAFRMDGDVPLLIPGVNDQHLALIETQQKNRDWNGYIIPIPNCTTYGLACSLAPLQDLGIESVVMTSMQATSGAGRQGGVLALDMLDNLVPYIPGEEEKVEKEADKILGSFDGQRVNHANFEVSCTCIRVPVTDGHTEAVFVKTKQSGYDIETLRTLFAEYRGPDQQLPSAPKNFFYLHDDPFHPQPRIDRDLQGGMSTHIGRIRLEKRGNGLKYVLLSHNTKAGAAKGAILIAEQLATKNLL